MSGWDVVMGHANEFRREWVRRYLKGAFGPSAVEIKKVTTRWDVRRAAVPLSVAACVVRDTTGMVLVRSEENATTHVLECDWELDAAPHDASETPCIAWFDAGDLRLENGDDEEEQWKSMVTSGWLGAHASEHAVGFERSEFLDQVGDEVAGYMQPTHDWEALAAYMACVMPSWWSQCEEALVPYLSRAVEQYQGPAYFSDKAMQAFLMVNGWWQAKRGRSLLQKGPCAQGWATEALVRLFSKDESISESRRHRRGAVDNVPLWIEVGEHAIWTAAPGQSTDPRWACLVRTLHGTEKSLCVLRVR